jgi:hypothetical protein
VLLNFQNLNDDTCNYHLLAFRDIENKERN